MTDRKYCGHGTVMGHGHTEVCGSVGYDPIKPFQCGDCKAVELNLEVERLSKLVEALTVRQKPSEYNDIKS